MSKVQLLIVMVIFFIFSAFLAVSLSGTSVEMCDIDPNPLFTNMQPCVIQAVDMTNWWSIAGYVGKLLTFQVEGLPNVISLFVFWPLSLGILFIILELAVEAFNAIWPF